MMTWSLFTVIILLAVFSIIGILWAVLIRRANQDMQRLDDTWIHEGRAYVPYDMDRDPTHGGPP